MRVDVTEAARGAVEAVVASGRTSLSIVISNGCCDATAPYLFSEHLAPAGATEVGEIEGVPILAPAWIVSLYGEDASLTVDAVTQEPDDSMSLETDHGVRLVLRAPGNEGKG